jgi:hypothetical protein
MWGAYPLDVSFGGGRELNVRFKAAVDISHSPVLADAV